MTREYALASPLRARRLVGAAVVTACLGAGSPVLGNVAFEDVTATAGPFNRGETWGVSWGDLNADGWPDIFISNHRFPSAVYRNERNGTFTDVTAEVDVTGSLRQLTPNSRDTHGGTWNDYDNDGDQDLFVLAGRQTIDQYTVNEGGLLHDRTAAFGFNDTGSTADLAGRMAVMLDYDRDGVLDLLQATIGTVSLHRGEGGGFTDVTAAVGMNWNQAHFAQLSDLDGDRTMEIIGVYQNRFPARVYDTSQVPFADVTASVPKVPYVLDSVTGDFDGDGTPDLLLVRSRWLRLVDAALADSRSLEAQLHGSEKTVSFRSNGNVTFEIHGEKFAANDILVGGGGWTPSATRFTLSPTDSRVQGLKAHNAKKDKKIFVGLVNGEWKLQNSGDTNFYLLVKADQDITGLSLDGLAADEHPYAPVLLVNGAEGLREKTDAGFDAGSDCISGGAGDFDNDMDLDVYLVCRGGVRNLANRLYMNNGDGTFVEVPATGAVGAVGMNFANGAGTGDSVVVADYDLDGFLDLFVANGINQHKAIDDGGPGQLFRNQGNAHHWIQIDLEGAGQGASNRDGTGATVYVASGGKLQLREQNGGYHRWSQNFKRVHFGLSTAGFAHVRVIWPSGLQHVYRGVPGDKIYVARENPPSLTVLPEGTVTPPPPPPPPPATSGAECGAPDVKAGSERGLFLWKDCAAGTWFVRATAGGPDRVIYQGTVTAAGDFPSVLPYSIEGGDFVNDEVTRIAFELRVANAGSDGIDFRLPAGSVCLRVSADAAFTLQLGAERQPVAAPLDLTTLGACPA